MEEKDRFTAEAELQTLALNHKYFRNKRVSDMVAALFMVLPLLLATALVVEYVRDPSFRAFVIEKVEENFSGLIVALLTIAGIRYSASNGNGNE
jgi:ABC-type sulfate transport system permease component